MKSIHPDPREPSKLFPPNGPFDPHRCAICNGRFEVGQQFYNYGQGEVVHTKCRFQKAAHGMDLTAATLVVLTKDGETAVKFQTIYFPQQEAEK